ncbi:MAG: hypothetical protein ACKO91_00030 [Acidimicrobiales bacterium]
MRSLGRAWFVAVFAAAAVIGFPGTAGAQTTAPADAAFAAVDLLVADTQTLVHTMTKDIDDAESISSALPEIPRLASYATSVQRDLAAVGAGAPTAEQASWATLEDRVRTLGLRLSTVQADVAFARPAAVSAVIEDLQKRLDLVRGAKRAVIDGWSARAVEPLTTATVGLGGLSAFTLALGALMGVLGGGSGRRRLLWSVSLSLVLLAFGTGIAAAMHLQFVRTASLSVVSLLPVGVFGLIATVVLTESRRSAESPQHARTSAGTPPLPEVRVDNSAGMMVWGEKLDALEQLRRRN